MASVRLAALLNVIFDETKELPTGLSEPLEGECGRTDSRHSTRSRARKRINHVVVYFAFVAERRD